MTSTSTVVASAAAAQYLRLHLADSIGPVLLGRLIRHFGNIESVLGASQAELERVEDIGPRRSRAVLEARQDDKVDREIERATKAGVRIICWQDPDYPPHLRHCNDPPICLFVRGRLEPEDALAIAIVGSRHCTQYGREQAHRFGSLLAGAGFTVVSGLARGIDSCAHEGALAGKGRTVAVLGSGVDVIYPPEHLNLAQNILESGAIISEDPVGSAPTAESFPRRNRIIAGMSLGTIVVEASKRSGALITARLAADYNREVFALPGRVDRSESAGTNDLIRTGAAKLVACLEDVLDELGDVGRLMAAPPPAAADQPAPPDDATGTLFDSAASPRPSGPALGDEAKAVLAAISADEIDIDTLVTKTGLPVAKVSATLTDLQLKGLIRALPGNRFVRRGQSQAG